MKENTKIRTSFSTDLECRRLRKCFSFDMFVRSSPQRLHCTGPACSFSSIEPLHVTFEHFPWLFFVCAFVLSGTLQEFDVEVPTYTLTQTVCEVRLPALLALETSWQRFRADLCVYV